MFEKIELVYTLNSTAANKETVDDFMKEFLVENEKHLSAFFTNLCDVSTVMR